MYILFIPAITYQLLQSMPALFIRRRGPARHGAFAFLSSESLDRDDLATAMKSRSNIGRKAHKADAAAS